MKESFTADELQPLPDAPLNQEERVVVEQINSNIRCQWPQVRPHPPNGLEVAVVCGGPSLNSTADELKELAEAGVPLCATNGSALWLLERGFTPNMHVIVDSRAFNKRFIDPPIITCTYVLASQCHPSLFAALNGHPKAYIGHFGQLPARTEVPDYFKRFVIIPGGSTVGLSTITLLSLLGYKDQHVFGLDSCYLGDAHHAYAQAENDNVDVYEWEYLGKKWHGTLWMMQQAQDFVRGHAKFDLFPALQGTQLQLHGDGLIRHIVQNYRPEEHGDNFVFDPVRKL